MRSALVVVLLAIFGGAVFAQTSDVKGLSARPSPAEYQTAVKIGNYTLSADFNAHGVPTSDGVFSTEDYVIFEVAFFGPAGAKLALRTEDFSIRINGKKVAAPAQSSTLVFHSLKDPEWEQAHALPPKSQSKTGINGGGGGGEDAPPPPPKMTIEEERKMELRVQKASLPEGERALPVAGLIFFQYSGKTKNIKSMDLIYSGAAGKATIPMQP